MKKIFLVAFIAFSAVSFSFASQKASPECIDKCLKDSKNYTKDDCNLICSGVNVFKDGHKEIRYKPAAKPNEPTQK